MFWSRLRRLVQLTSFVAFVWLTLAGLSHGSTWLFSGLFSRLDPLVGLSAMVASRTFMAFWVLAGATLLLTLVFGRAWCGWLCPLGTALEYAPTRKLLKRRIPRGAKLGKYVTLALVLGAAAFGSLGPMVLDPVTIVTRPLQELGRALLGNDAVGQSVGAAIGRDGLQAVAWLSLVPLSLVLALNLVDRRFWCANLCPLGGLLGVLSAVPGVRRIVNAETCTGCARCAKACPTDAINRKDGYSTSSPECVACMKCVAVCPEHANSFGIAMPRLFVAGYNPSRRATIIAVGATGAALAGAMAPVALAQGAQSETLRPPATDEARLAELCVRCGACYGACPTGSLRPSVSFLTEAGPWTPMLDDRPQHCTEKCNRCAAPCPTDAIHTFTPEEVTRMGLDVKATIDRTRCRAWANNHVCMQCAPACPIAGALGRVERPSDLPVRGMNPSHEPVEVPVIDTSLCIGCNLCAGSCVMTPPAIGAPLTYDPSVPGSSGMRTLTMPNGQPVEVPEDVYEAITKGAGGKKRGNTPSMPGGTAAPSGMPGGAPPSGMTGSGGATGGMPGGYPQGMPPAQ